MDTSPELGAYVRWEPCGPVVVDEPPGAAVVAGVCMEHDVEVAGRRSEGILGPAVVVVVDDDGVVTVVVEVNDVVVVVATDAVVRVPAMPLGPEVVAVVVLAAMYTPLELAVADMILDELATHRSQVLYMGAL